MQIRKERYNELIRKEYTLENIKDVIKHHDKTYDHDKVEIIKWLLEVCDEGKN